MAQSGRIWSRGHVAIDNLELGRKLPKLCLLPYSLSLIVPKPKPLSILVVGALAVVLVIVGISSESSGAVPRFWTTPELEEVPSVLAVVC